jgi:hypothetical protein
MTNLTVDTDRTTNNELATLGQGVQDKIYSTVSASKAANTLRAYKSTCGRSANIWPTQATPQ